MKKLLHISTVVILGTLWLFQVSAFEIDFSRREKYLKPYQQTQQSPEAAQKSQKTPEPLSEKRVVNSFDPGQDVVILNTEKGFVPASVSLRAGVKYNIHVVNVNEKEKNVSFIMSSFSQHHGTYFGQIKSFEVVPEKEGVYTYQCPETSLEGRVVVLPPANLRALANE